MRSDAYCHQFISRPREIVLGWEWFLIIVVVLHPVAAVTIGRAVSLVTSLATYAALLVLLAVGRVHVGDIARLWKILAYFALIPTTTIWARNPGDTLRGSLVFLAISPVVLYGAYTTSRQGRRQWIARTSVALPIVSLFVYIYLYIAWGSPRSVSREMRDAVGAVANVASYTTTAFLPFLLYARRVRRVSPIVGNIALTAAIMVVFASQSRGAYLLLILVTILASSFFGTSFISRIRFMVVIALVLSVAVGATLATVGYDRSVGRVVERYQRTHLSSGDLSGDLRSIDARGRGDDFGRVLMYASGIDAIRRHGLLGIGFRGIPSYSKERYGNLMNFYVVSHNVLMTAWGELGLLGFILFVGTTLDAIRRPWKARARARNTSRENFYFHSAALTAWIIAFSEALLQPSFNWPIFYVILGIALAADGNTRLRRRSRAERESIAQ